MKIFTAILTAPIAALLSLSENTIAECQESQNQPTQQFFVAFESNSYQITPLEQKRLKQWVSEINSKYSIQNWTYIIGSASKNEIDPDQLAIKRASAVTKSIIDDGLIIAPFQIKTQIYPTNSTADASTETREVTVQVSPGCRNNCCTG
ncbi:OmpA family protein [Burkholderia sp. Ac-20353]|uniref:OmpA family protein n=1 Tax=Burkholderia sp. Ac-20353 TaxID=2703894 RepID=UPI00197C0C6F|nr:OmpA family protein [Burkholderia sp. Ac-20353]MBN3787574.1 OmpA family protein [Burkholderia sp. Ac-20353]